ncbi:MAG: SDR family oxidoreductase [Acidobacteria bacterium]|nr:SDR family oxidoreductase [Acidobacteriota bacterium]
MEIKDRVALVTGGCSGIGRAICVELARCGADVAFVDVHGGPGADSLTQEITDRGRRPFFFQADVSDYERAQECSMTLLRELGRVDFLVNNAGISSDATVWKMSEAQWDTVLNVNLKGAFNYTHAFAPVMRERRSGVIINISSINALRGKFGLSNYSASKAGLIGLTKSVAREMGKYNVRVNAIAPGFIQTSMMEKLPPNFKEEALAETLLNRLGLPEDVANLVSFLCSDRARHITGEVIKIDGGQYL